jgi:hypothetical protein
MQNTGYKLMKNPKSQASNPKQIKNSNDDCYPLTGFPVSPFTCGFIY